MLVLGSLHGSNGAMTHEVCFEVALTERHTEGPVYRNTKDVYFLADEYIPGPHVLLVRRALFTFAGPEGVGLPVGSSDTLHTGKTLFTGDTILFYAYLLHFRLEAACIPPFAP